MRSWSARRPCARAATGKGKGEPLMVWRVLGERATTETEDTPFVGRASELATLLERFDEVERSGSTRAIAIVAEAGVGKSPLVAELASPRADRAGSVSGSCPPYGEGVTFAPIEQTVRTLVGMDPSDDAVAAAACLQEYSDRVEADERDRRWLVRTLGAVLALGSEGVGADEIAQAWARALGAAAATRPLLLVVEDLHDAAPAFVEVLAATAELLAERPVLILATTRPEALLPEGWATLPLGALGPAG